jgi:hypothetical protein
MAYRNIQFVSIQFVGAVLIVSALASQGRADSPVLLAIEPPCGQAGTRQEVVLRGFRLVDAEEIFCHEPGVKVEILGPAETWKPGGEGARRREVMRAAIEIPANIDPGNVYLRVRTRTGLSNPRSFHVNRLPIVARKEGNIDRDHPQPLPLEHTLWGNLPKNETHWYGMDLVAGQRVSLELLGLRISPTYIDARIRIFEPTGSLLLEADTSPAYYHDPACAFRADKAGEYLVSIDETRNGIDQDDTRYGFGSDCFYVLHAGDFPQPRSLFPLGGRCGTDVSFTFSGDLDGPWSQGSRLPNRATFQKGPVGSLHNAWPFRAPEAIYPVRRDATGKEVRGTGPLFFMASDHTCIPEQANHADAEHAQALPVGSIAVDGIIATTGEVDWYRIQGSPGKDYTVEVFARRLRSPLDSLIRAYPAGLDGIAVENDDIQGYNIDSAIQVKMKPEGCLIAVTDSREQGGADYGYRLVVEETRPHAVLTTLPLEPLTHLPLFKTGQQVAVPRGGRMLVLLKVLEEHGSMPVLDVVGSALPPGVVAEAGTMPARSDRLPIVLSAKPDAVRSLRLVKPIAKARTADGGGGGGGGSSVPPIEFQQEIGMIYGHPAQTAWHLAMFDSLAVAVIDPLPFAVSLACESPRVVAGAKATLVVSIARDASWQRPVTVMFPCLPPGATVGMVHADPTQSQLSAVLEVPANCPPGRWPIVAVATDSDLAHLRNHGWPYYSDSNAAKDTHGLNWVSSGIAYLEVEKKP